MALGFELAALNVGLVAVLCGLIAAATWRAVLRTGNRRIGYVTAAFALLTLKNLVKAVLLSSSGGESAAMEIAFSLTDLVAVALIAWPLVLRRSA